MNEGPQRDERAARGDRWTLMQKLLGLLTAVLTLATATLGFLAARAASERDEVQRESDQLASELDATTEERDGLATDLDQARERIDELEEDQPAAPTSSSPDGTTPPVTSGPQSRDSTVFRQTGDTPVIFSESYSIDLDSDAPDWGVSDLSGGDVSFYKAAGSWKLSTQEISLVDHIPTEAECDDATVLQPGLTTDQTRVGVQMCMLTNEERWSYIRIAAIDDDAGTVALDVIVWQ